MKGSLPALSLSAPLFLAGLLPACHNEEDSGFEEEAGSPEICDDGLDNDIDASTDCDDPDCEGFEACLPLEELEVFGGCSNGEDDDGDGLIDCDDSECLPLNECACFVDAISLSANQLPVVIEGDTSDGRDLVSFCQEDGAVEDFIPLRFTAVGRVDLQLVSDDEDMVLTVFEGACSNNPLFSNTCLSEGVARDFDVVDGTSLLVYVGARQAGQTGTYRLTISAP